MVRKVISLAVCLAILFAFGVGSQANAYEIYDEGNISSTYVTYFRDIVSGIPFNHNYVAFRAGQYEYVMVVGEMEYSNGTFTLVGDTAQVYTFDTDGGNYNQQYNYEVSTISNFNLSVNNRIIYSDLGQYPQLVARGEKYEMLNTILIIVLLLGLVVRSFFRPR